MNKTSAKHIAACSVFLVGLAVLLLLASYIYRPRDNTKRGGMDYIGANGYLGEPDGTLDVCFIGSSLTYSDISPMRIWNEKGITSYDVAVGAQRISGTTYYVEQVLKHQHPKVIMIDTYVLINPDNPDKMLFNELSKRFPILENHNNWKIFNWDKITAPVSYTNREVNKGFRPRGKTTVTSFEGFMEPSDEVAYIPMLNKLYLHYIKSLCDRHGVELVILSPPNPRDWDYPYHNAIQAIADKNGIAFLDLNLIVDELEINPETDFRDNGDHLNGPGAWKVSVYLAKYLADNYGLEDHREDETYAAWHEDYAKYPEW